MKPYLKVVAERAGQAVQVLDRFHIMSHFSQGDRRSARGRSPQARRRGPGAGAQAQPLAPAQASENLTDGQAERLAELVRRNLRTVRAYLLKEDFPAAVGLRVAVLGGAVSRPLVHSDDALAARADEGCCPHGALAPRPDPELVPSPGQFSSGVVEGFNGKARVITKRAYGFRTSGALEVALYHALGDLPEPELTHRFC